MNILLDTHILLWFLTDDERLSNKQAKEIENQANKLFFSMASLWEIAIKTNLLKLEIPKPIDILVPKEIEILDIRISHIISYQSLPFHHRDPFDRMLIAQSIYEDFHLMTDDSKFKEYDIQII